MNAAGYRDLPDDREFTVSGDLHEGQRASAGTGHDVEVGIEVALVDSLLDLLGSPSDLDYMPCSRIPVSPFPQGYSVLPSLLNIHSALTL